MMWTQLMDTPITIVDVLIVSVILGTVHVIRRMLRQSRTRQSGDAMNTRAVVAETEVTVEPLSVWIDPGKATAQVVADVLIAISNLQREHGGRGFTWKLSGKFIDLANGHRAYEFIAERL